MFFIIELIIIDGMICNGFVVVKGIVFFVILMFFIKSVVIFEFFFMWVNFFGNRSVVMFKLIGGI